jgi:hypothetical protein
LSHVIVLPGTGEEEPSFIRSWFFDATFLRCFVVVTSWSLNYSFISPLKIFASIRMF